MKHLSISVHVFSATVFFIPLWFFVNLLDRRLFKFELGILGLRLLIFDAWFGLFIDGWQASSVLQMVADHIDHVVEELI